MLRTIALAVFCAAFLAALAFPFLALRKTQGAARRAARLHAGAALLVLAVAGAAACGWSLSAHFANVVLVLAALAAGLMLAVFALDMRPAWLGRTVGALCALGWTLVLLVQGLTAAFDGNSALTVALDDGLVCRESVYGMAASDSGTDISLYRRHAVVDRELLSLRRSDVFPQADAPVPASLRAPLARCQALVRRARTDAMPE